MEKKSSRTSKGRKLCGQKGKGSTNEPASGQWRLLKKTEGLRLPGKTPGRKKKIREGGGHRKW